MAFARVGFEKLAVVRQRVYGTHLHAPFDTAEHGGALVLLEIVAGAVEQEENDALQRLLGKFDRVLPGQVGDGTFAVPGRWQFDDARVFPKLDQLLRHVDHRQYEVDDASADGRLRHAVVFCIGGQLRDRDPALFLDPCEADGAVRARTRQHDRHRPLAVYLSKGTEEQVDGDVGTARTFQRAQAEDAVDHRHVMVGRDDVHVIGLDFDRLQDLYYRHARDALQDLVGRAVVLGRQVQDRHEGHAGIMGHVFEELDQRRQPAGGRTDADHRKRECARHDARVGGGRTGRNGGIVHGRL
jgi:hypothetical protein